MGGGSPAPMPTAQDLSQGCGDARRLPRSPSFPATPPRHHPPHGRGSGGSTPKVAGGRRRVGTQPWALPLGAVPARVGGISKTRPPSAVTRRSSGSRHWHGDKPGREAAPQHLGERNNPRAFLFWQAPGAPASAPLPVLLLHSGAGIQLNQCSANNLPANKTFSSLSLLPPTPPQSVCDGSALI